MYTLESKFVLELINYLSFSNLEYGLMAEQLGKSRTASEVSSPTTKDALR